jgi:glutaredoxin
MHTAERVRVFWQPGCTSCLRTKEFLSKHGVDYESINVHGNPAGMEALRELGARSVPVVARGGEFVFAQSLADVVRFLELDIRLHDKLAPQQLVDKLGLVLNAAARYVRQIPADSLERPFRNRNRPIRELAHHVFRIPEAFVEAMREGRVLTYELIMQPPGEALRTGEDIARYGMGVLAAFHAWWDRYDDRACQRMMDTYFGRHRVHEVLERSVWHPAQHARQLMLLLEELGIEPAGRLGAADLAGLPLPEKAWDD